MKILCISNLYPPHCLGGYEILCKQVCDRLARRGHDVQVLTSTHGLEDTGQKAVGSSVSRELELYIPFSEAARLARAKRRQTGRRNYRKTTACIQRLHPDRIFIWSQLRLTLGAAKAAEASGVPTFYTFNDEHIAGYLPARPGWNPVQMIRWVVDRLVYPDITLQGVQFTRATCISQQVKNNLLASGVAALNLTVIYQGIPIEKFPLKSGIGVIHKPVRLLYVGQLYPYKGVHTLLQAAHRLSGKFAVHVTIIGEGPQEYTRQLQELAGSGPATVTFTGKYPHSKLSEMYRAHDIFIFPSIWQEPFGLTHLEAMAIGLPVVSTADGGHGEFLQDGYNAMIFQKENVEDLTEKIRVVIQDGCLRRRLARTARHVVEQRFTIDRYVDDLSMFLALDADGRSR